MPGTKKRVPLFGEEGQRIRKVPVRREVAELVRRLRESAPAGSGTPLFRNTRGRPWKKVTGVGRFRKIRKTLGWDKDPIRKTFSTYSARHTFAHRMLSGFWNGGVGCSIETLGLAPNRGGNAGVTQLQRFFQISGFMPSYSPGKPDDLDQQLLV